MRLKVRHETVYRYEAPATAAIQVLRLTPRNHDGQFVKRWRVEIDADNRLTRDEDPFGNVTHTFSIEGPFEALRILVEGEVDTFFVNGLLRGTMERMPLGFWLRSTAMTEADTAIRDFALSLAQGEGGDVLATAHALMAALHRSLERLPAENMKRQSAAKTFAAKSGTVQDIAQVFVAAARTLDIPARYVSGYMLLEDETPQRVHAWAEAHIPHIGWIAFDPCHGVCVTDRYIRLATGLDSRDAAPVRGARTGGEREDMAVNLQVSTGWMLVEG